MTFLKVGMLDPSYSLYKTLVNVQGANLIKIPFIDDEFTFDPKQISSSGANLFFLTSPHAPSGRSFFFADPKENGRIFSGLLVIDEAYADFAAETALPLLNDLENVLITRTLSKSYSLAGLRLGFAMGHPSIIAQLDQVREVYNVDRLAQAAALASLNDQNYFSNCLEKIMEQRQWLTNQFEAMNWRTIPSSTNFVFTQPCDASGKRGEKIAKSLFEFLNRRKILVRYFPDHPLYQYILKNQYWQAGGDDYPDGFNRKMEMSRKASIERNTSETQISLDLLIDGSGINSISTGIPFLDHMLELFSRHGFFDLKIQAKGDLQIDYHHLVEDLGIALGQAFGKALGDKSGIKRYGYFIAPMDETLVTTSVDLSNRPFLFWQVVVKNCLVRDFNIQLLKEFFQSFANEVACNLHIRLEHGDEPHHVAEGIFKSLAKSLDMATSAEPRLEGKVPSTKGTLSK